MNVVSPHGISHLALSLYRQGSLSTMSLLYLSLTAALLWVSLCLLFVIILKGGNILHLQRNLCALACVSFGLRKYQLFVICGYILGCGVAE